MVALSQAASRLTDGESMSVGRDGASDAVAFLKAGVPAVEFGPSGGGHHGPDEWVSIESLARYRRALTDFARSVPERFSDTGDRTAGGRGRLGVRDPNRPPKPGRGVLIRALIAGILTVSLSATAVASAVLLEIDDVVDTFTQEGRTAIDIPEVSRAEAGDPRTFLLLGSDERYGDKQAQGSSRARTRSCSSGSTRTRKRIAVMSLPRDLKVQVPGAGTNKINAAYEIGGPRKTVATIQRLFEDATGEEFPIHNVINVNFGGFRRAINYVNGVYVDVDRRYYNDNSTANYGEAYATIDVQPGYQRLKGQDALDYVRYRHGDNDFYRASRQQDFLRQASRQDTIRALLDVGKRKELARIFGRYFEVDKSFTKASNLISLARTGQFMVGQKAPVNEVRFPAYEAENPAIDSYLYVKDSALRKTYREFMTGKGSSSPRKATETTPVSSRDARGQAGPQAQQAVVDQGPRAGARRGREHGDPGRDPGQPRLPVLLPGPAQDRLALRRLRAAHLHRSGRATARSTRRTGSCSTPGPTASTTASRAWPGGTRRSSTTRTRSAPRTAAS